MEKNKTPDPSSNLRIGDKVKHKDDPSTTGVISLIAGDYALIIDPGKVEGIHARHHWLPVHRLRLTV